MTVEEKAKEYAESKHKDKELQKIVAWDFIAGAEWKEEQFKQYLLHGKKFAQEKGNQDLAGLFEIMIEDLKL